MSQQLRDRLLKLDETYAYNEQESISNGIQPIVISTGSTRVAAMKEPTPRSKLKKTRAKAVCESHVPIAPFQQLRLPSPLI